MPSRVAIDPWNTALQSLQVARHNLYDIYPNLGIANDLLERCASLLQIALENCKIPSQDQYALVKEQLQTVTCDLLNFSDSTETQRVAYLHRR